MWAKKSDDGSIHDWSTVYSWDDAFAVYVATLNSTNFAGHNDWRMPNAKELQSIVNYQNFNPSVSPAFDTGCAPACTVLTCSCTEASNYWSSTTAAGAIASAWTVDFFNGGVYAGGKINGTFRVRAVRGGS
jgi:hypothetical protein